MILSKIILATTISATALWFMPTQSNGQHSTHGHCDCGHDHCGVDCGHDHCDSDCGHSDAEHAMLTTAGPDTSADHSAVYAAKEKCSSCNGKGKITQTCSKCNGKKRIPKPGQNGLNLLYQDCDRCDRVLGFPTGKESTKCEWCNGKGKV